MINSRSKGARGEIMWRDMLRTHFKCQDAERGCQCSGSIDSPDVKNGIPGTHCEVKYTEKLNLSKAMLQAITDSQSNTVDLVPYVASRKKGEQWLVTIPATQLLQFCRNLVNHIDT